MENVYQQNGYENRAEYLNSLADEMGVDLEVVRVAADMLGETEDFDGLVTTLQDYEGGFC